MSFLDGWNPVLISTWKAEIWTGSNLHSTVTLFQIFKKSENVKCAKFNDKVQNIDNASKFLLNFIFFLFFDGVTNETKPLTLL